MTLTRWIAVVVLLAVVIALAIVVFRPPGPVPSPVAPAGACADWRWIGIKNSSDPCPDPQTNGLPSWTGGALFSQGHPELPELAGFCSYQRNEAGPMIAGELDALEDLRSRAFAQLERDCLVVVPAADVERDRTLRLRDHFLNKVGAVPVPPNARPTVRLALLDTSPTSPTSPKATITGAPQDHPPAADGSRHGYTLANLAAEMLCAGGASSGCAVQITSRLALPVKRFNASQWQPGDRAAKGEGGYVGSLGDLAVAIRDELEEWDPGLGIDHLVMNLALGWDPAHFGGRKNQVKDMYPAVQAVYWALQKAACQDVLVVAAAGNLLGGQRESGPLLPAGWETREPRCAGSAGNYRPLLYAAGGVRSDDRPLANARPGGMPRLVAFGDHAVSWSSQGQATATLTGSSVATIVTAATAAAVWDAQRRLVPPAVLEHHQVMDELYRTGTVYPGSPPRADFYLRPATPKTTTLAPERKRVMLCAALGVACPKPASTPFLSQFVQPIKKFKGPFPTTTQRPFKTHPGLMARPWLGPQPESDPCPPCYEDPANQSGSASIPSTSGPDRIRLRISPQFDAASLTDATLVIGGTSYKLTGVTWPAGGGWIEITGLSVNQRDDVTLEFTVIDKQGKLRRSAMSALLVTQ